MIQYTIRRLLMAVFVIWGVSTICFMLTHIDELNRPLNSLKERWPLSTEPVRRFVRENFNKDLREDFKMGMGDPARLMLGQHGDVNTQEEIRKELGLDKPLWKQYQIFLVGETSLSDQLFYLTSGREARVERWGPRARPKTGRGLVFGDLGDSYKTRKPCLDRILDKLQNTAKLALAAILIAMSLGIGAGILAATFQDTWIDRSCMSLCILGLSAPIYLVGLVLILLIIKHLGWIGGVGMAEEVTSKLQLWLGGFLFEVTLPTYVILPALALGVRPASNLARMTRSSMLEVIRQDYIRTARAKGLSEPRVILVHAMKNALIPVVTILGLEMAGLLTGAVLTESVFAWPGLGRLTVSALRDLDLPLIQACVIFIAMFFVISNLIVDLTYAILDPRIRMK